MDDVRTVDFIKKKLKIIFSGTYWICCTKVNPYLISGTNLTYFSFCLLERRRPVRPVPPIVRPPRGNVHRSRSNLIVEIPKKSSLQAFGLPI